LTGGSFWSVSAAGASAATTPAVADPLVRGVQSWLYGTDRPDEMEFGSIISERGELFRCRVSE
jgi:hypothetical protein